jgi:hypothetical protein
VRAKRSVDVDVQRGRGGADLLRTLGQTRAQVHDQVGLGLLVEFGRNEDVVEVMRVQDGPEILRSLVSSLKCMLCLTKTL